MSTRMRHLRAALGLAADGRDEDRVAGRFEADERVEALRLEVRLDAHHLHADRLAGQFQRASLAATAATRAEGSRAEAEQKHPCIAHECGASCEWSKGVSTSRKGARVSPSSCTQGEGRGDGAFHLFG